MTLAAATYVTLWFVFTLTAAGTEPTGYLEPLTVRNPPCGIAGAVVGVTYDRTASPTTVYWPDPYFPGTHCAVDVRGALSALPQGTYHFATTVQGETGTADFTTYPDPHTSADWTIGNLPPPPVSTTGLRLTGTGMQVPATRTLSWDPNPPAEKVVKYQVTVDGVAYPDTTATSQVVTLPAYRTYQFAVRAFNASGQASAPATLSYTLEAPPPPPPPPPPPVATVTCTVISVARYADLDAKLTVRCNTNGTPVFPKGLTFTLPK